MFEIGRNRCLGNAEHGEYWLCIDPIERFLCFFDSPTTRLCLPQHDVNLRERIDAANKIGMLCFALICTKNFSSVWWTILKYRHKQTLVALSLGESRMHTQRRVPSSIYQSRSEAQAGEYKNGVIKDHGNGRQRGTLSRIQQHDSNYWSVTTHRRGLKLKLKRNGRPLGSLEIF